MRLEGTKIMRLVGTGDYKSGRDRGHRRLEGTGDREDRGDHESGDHEPGGYHESLVSHLLVGH